jgi:hypothetical protein
MRIVLIVGLAMAVPFAIFTIGSYLAVVMLICWGEVFVFHF